jgi:hypothetical protein
MQQAPPSVAAATGPLSGLDEPAVAAAVARLAALFQLPADKGSRVKLLQVAKKQSQLLTMARH